MNLNQVTLPVRDMAEAAAFYRRLGFVQIVDTPHYARFESTDGGATFSLQLSDEKFHNGAVIYFELEALDTLVEELQHRGVEFAQLPQDMRWRWREAVLFDPSGNKVKLYWAGEDRLHPPWRTEIRD
ncbi:glyoxalase/bleomycin resistance/dioxygenase family protein [Microbulbifer flavimaris]|uniref:Glyoxalase/bleomycin resistance/dioxygenase family protein n=1 Tax=Microbulbifer flavimaris TaxID=1781068 RepID=A0ABX4I2A2_9GAMM|nr:MULTISPECIES: VOC family protein [Microbulbifer]KUJ84453.1 glyoxalase [Microbulbifer sp. ZGT114]PCO06540.1 glyoxalase/bleomycin resistance/dioxygenase family protein [Microbulbifer flavimaris]